MNFTMIAAGTRGDVQPPIALGRALKARGHSVRLFASVNFRGWIEAHGLEAADTGVNIQELMESEGGVAWVEKGHNPLVQAREMKRLLDDVGWELVWDAWEACQGADAIFTSFTSDTPGTAMAEKLGVPQISAPLQPALFATRDGWAVPNTPLSNRRSLFNLLFGKVFIEPYPWQMFGDLTVRLRRELGLPPQSARENLANRREILTLNAYSPHVVPQPPEWPSNFHTTGYWFQEEKSAWEPPADLAAFLEGGPPPVYIGFGSMTGRAPRRTTELVQEALVRSGQRAIVAAGWAGLGEMRVPETVYQLESAPHSWLFPRMAAVVHHGGAGTTAAGLRAGVPTLIVPHIVDQPFWGQRVFDLGVGPRSLPRHKLTAAKLARGIEIAVTDSGIRQRASALGAKIRAEDGIGTAVRLIEGRLGG